MHEIMKFFMIAVIIIYYKVKKAARTIRVRANR